MKKAGISLFMASAMALSMLSGCGSSSTVESVKEKTEEDVVEEYVPNQDYLDALATFGLDDISFEYDSLDEACYAIVGEDNAFIEIMSFGYKNDLAKEMYDRIYYTVTGYTDDQIASVDSYMKETFASIASNDWCEMTTDYDADKELYILQLHYTGLDDKDHVSTMVDEGVLGLTEDANQISISATDEAAQDNGLIKR